MNKINKLLIKRHILITEELIKDIQDYQSKFESIHERRASYLSKDKKQLSSKLEIEI